MLSLLLSISTAFAWGPTGHRVVGLVAERHVSPETLAEIRSLMGPETLARAATWPDQIRSDPAWQQTHPDAWRYHFINAPEGQPLAFPDEEEGAGPSNIHQAFRHYRRVLGDRSLPEEDRRVALRWLVHLAGDAHQPLHAGGSMDEGGNTRTVAWFDEKTNLHAVWDEKLIEHTRLSYTELTDFIDHPTPGQIMDWQAVGMRVWLEESRTLLPACYETGDGWLAHDYAWAHTPTVERRLLQAGVRLAAVLDRAFSEGRGSGPRARKRRKDRR